MHIKLVCCKQTVDGETEEEEDENGECKETFVWADNEVELLLRPTLNYKESKLQDRLNIFCSTNTSM